ncbi:TPA: hypothetical protein DDW69_04065 [candidate division CPR2 bacterium]|uniref:Uncharacterized protein n=1 Tax=candidate division CPR2 bacterium GW2011_GWC1_41_48 TaxID=1618344 RepID=A0A0G0Z878_UNCC2|nr:MAG: hypothetical protein UT47_C0002G0298 [candidate division CPR2 bacterium GW2011_GWC2_39_35]KKR27634.1 MAG: hypothetical protein UT60_C0043G0002 [candidate division CPR2 bacterium GW2011_GWD2_39_7]KKR29046.1 MAG: hypothetical protein UT59_C0013G0001 [candidate division CPR2 bacterium GW2011_GWD1_39_7]KKS09228.1 MAG: hypothetical protein UU65_C0002G0006 [candidate division CPR2 bacterium GW2011_GWC1_41_48]OGB61814.1 MAG: hypothetical protein A2Y27_02965 [candidate division CPR2 bacterium G
MVNQQIVDYIKNQLARGNNKTQVKNSLISVGWKEEAIGEAFEAIDNESKALAASSTPPLDSVKVAEGFNTYDQPSSELSGVNLMPGADPSNNPQDPENFVSSNSRGTAERLPGGMALLKEAISIYKTNFALFIKILSIPIGLSLITGVLSSFITKDFSSGLMMGLVGLIGLLSLVSFIVNIISQIAFLYGLSKRDEGITPSQAYKNSLSRFFSYLWIVILLVMIVFGGFLLFIIPGFIFSLWFSFAIFVLISEDIRGMDALLRSKMYMRGQFGAVGWRITFLFLIALAIFIPIMIAFAAFSFTSNPGMFSGAVSEPSPAMSILNILVNSISMATMAPIASIYSFLIYSHLRQIKKEEAQEFVPTSRQRRGFFAAGCWGLVAIIIIPAVLIFGVAKYMSTGGGSNILKSISEANAVKNNLESYYNEHKSYPVSLEELLSVESGISNKNNFNPFDFTYEQLEDGNDYKLCIKNMGPELACFQGSDVGGQTGSTIPTFSN